MLDEGVEFSKGSFDVAMADVFHRQAIASEGVCRIELKDFGERSDLVHEVDGAVLDAGLASAGTHRKTAEAPQVFFNLAKDVTKEEIANSTIYTGRNE